MASINERLDKVKDRFSDEKFLRNKGLGNETGVYIFDYDPIDEMTVRYFLDSIRSETKFHAIEYDLYDIFIDYLRERKLLDRVAPLEERSGKDVVEKQLKRMITQKLFVERMRYENHKFGDVVIISGVGKVYPFARVHTMLEAMTDEFKDVPVVVFYPGKYDGKTLTLFTGSTSQGLFDDNHYRSFALIR